MNLEKFKYHSLGKPFIIPIFIPHMGCPHRCVFCNQKVTTGVKLSLINESQIIQNIKHYLKYRSAKRSLTQVSFYGGTFLGLSKQKILKLLEIVTPFIDTGSIDSIRFSTRPDTINSDTLSLIQPYPVKTIELGVQSMDDDVLKSSNRGHTSYDTNYAVCKIKDAGYDIGIQMMIGLPGDNENKTMKTVKKIAVLDPKFVRIYPTIVMRNSLLSDMYKNGLYDPMKLDDCIVLTKKIFLFFRSKGIPVIRIGLQYSEDLDYNSKLVAGPYHPAFGHMVYSSIFLDSIKFVLSTIPFKSKSIIIGVNSKNISRVQGLKCNNIKILKSDFNLDSILIEQRDDISTELLDISGYLIKVY